MQAAYPTGGSLEFRFRDNALGALLAFAVGVGARVGRVLRMEITLR